MQGVPTILKLLSGSTDAAFGSVLTKVEISAFNSVSFRLRAVVDYFWRVSRSCSSDVGYCKAYPTTSRVGETVETVVTNSGAGHSLSRRLVCAVISVVTLSSVGPSDLATAIG